MLLQIFLRILLFEKSILKNLFFLCMWNLSLQFKWLYLFIFCDFHKTVSISTLKLGWNIYWFFYFISYFFFRSYLFTILGVSADGNLCFSNLVFPISSCKVMHRLTSSMPTLLKINTNISQGLRPLLGLLVEELRVSSCWSPWFSSHHQYRHLNSFE